MKLPWFLNPWAEVRRLRETNFALNRNWCDALALLEEREQENAEFRRRFAEMNSRESGAGDGGFLRKPADLIHSLEMASKRQMTAQEIEIQ